MSTELLSLSVGESHIGRLFDMEGMCAYLKDNVTLN